MLFKEIKEKLQRDGYGIYDGCPYWVIPKKTFNKEFWSDTKSKIHKRRIFSDGFPLETVFPMESLQPFLEDV